MSKNKIFLVMCLCFIAGVFLGKYIHQAFGLILTGIFFALFTLSIGNRVVLVISLCGLIFLFGAFWLHVHERPSQLINYYDQKQTLTAVITEEPDERLDKTLLTISAIEINGLTIPGKIILFTGKYPEYFYGDKITVTGKIQEPSAGDEKDKFSYKDYLSRFGIDAVMYYPTMERTGEKQGNSLKFAILKFKKIFLGKLSLLIPEPNNSLLAGILVGAKRGMPQDLLDGFAATGTSHIIAISGFNITIIAQMLDKLFSRFGRRISFVLALICIGLFAILTGASASVIRAAVMGSILLLAQNVGRLFVIDNALALTAVIMLLFNPKILRFDVGFQLSFLALLGLVYLSPILEKKFFHWPEWLKKYLMPTVAAQVFTLPVILYNFERLSLIAPMANLIILPLVPFTMLAGFLVGLFGLFLFPLARLISWPAIIILEFVVKTIHLFANVPLAQIKFSFGPVWVIFYYAVLAGVLIFYNKNKWKSAPKN
jgi:competence protein ComEC